MTTEEQVPRRHRAADKMMRRRVGMNEENRQRLNEQLGLMKDWRVSCPACGANVVGSPAQIAQHGVDCAA